MVHFVGAIGVGVTFNNCVHVRHLGKEGDCGLQRFLASSRDRCRRYFELDVLKVEHLVDRWRLEDHVDDVDDAVVSFQVGHGDQRGVVQDDTPVVNADPQRQPGTGRHGLPVELKKLSSSHRFIEEVIADESVGGFQIGGQRSEPLGAKGLECCVRRCEERAIDWVSVLVFESFEVCLETKSAADSGELACFALTRERIPHRERFRRRSLRRRRRCLGSRGRSFGGRGRSCGGRGRSGRGGRDFSRDLLYLFFDGEQT